MAINKVAIDGNTLIDLSTDTVASADDIAVGKVGHLNDGTVVTGTHSGESTIELISTSNIRRLNGRNVVFKFDHPEFSKTAYSHLPYYFGGFAVKELYVKLSDNTTNLAYAFYRDGGASPSKINIDFNTHNVTSFQYMFRNLSNDIDNNPVCVVGQPLDLSSALSLTEMFYQGITPYEIRFVPNTAYVDFTLMPYIGTPHYSDDTLVSIANCLVGDLANTLICTNAALKSQITAILGYIDGSGLFVKDDNGTVTLTDFITNTKGWTIA